MKILVCIKQIISQDRPVDIAPDGKQLLLGTNPGSHMNKYDEYALEEALRLKEEFPQSTITAVSVGGETIKPILKRALEMGADEAFILSAKQSSFFWPKEVASIIADFARTRTFDLILTGVMAEDTMFAQTGPMLAALLNMACATSVIEQKTDLKQKIIEVIREIDAFNKDRLLLKLPALLTIQSGINQPRYPSLPNKLRAKKQDIPIIKSKLEDKPINTPISFSLYEREAKSTLFLSGDLNDKAQCLRILLQEKGLLK